MMNLNMCLLNANKFLALQADCIGVLETRVTAFHQQLITQKTSGADRRALWGPAVGQYGDQGRNRRSGGVDVIVTADRDIQPYDIDLHLGFPWWSSATPMWMTLMQSPCWTTFSYKMWRSTLRSKESWDKPLQMNNYHYQRQTRIDRVFLSEVVLFSLMKVDWRPVPLWTQDPPFVLELCKNDEVDERILERQAADRECEALLKHEEDIDYTMNAWAEAWEWFLNARAGHHRMPKTCQGKPPYRALIRHNKPEYPWRIPRFAYEPFSWENPSHGRGPWP